MCSYVSACMHRSEFLDELLALSLMLISASGIPWWTSEYVCVYSYAHKKRAWCHVGQDVHCTTYRVVPSALRCSYSRPWDPVVFVSGVSSVDPLPR